MGLYLKTDGWYNNENNKDPIFNDHERKVVLEVIERHPDLLSVIFCQLFVACARDWSGRRDYKCNSQ
jgi:hypothetical protein